MRHFPGDVQRHFNIGAHVPGHLLGFARNQQRTFVGDKRRSAGDFIESMANGFIRGREQDGPKPGRQGDETGGQQEAKNNFHKMTFPRIWLRLHRPLVWSCSAMVRLSPTTKYSSGPSVSAGMFQKHSSVSWGSSNICPLIITWPPTNETVSPGIATIRLSNIAWGASSRVDNAGESRMATTSPRCGSCRR